mgnify:CR=1 FL=1
MGRGCSQRATLLATQAPEEAGCRLRLAHGETLVSVARAGNTDGRPSLRRARLERSASPASPSRSTRAHRASVPGREHGGAGPKAHVAGEMGVSRSGEHPSVEVGRCAPRLVMRAARPIGRPVEPFAIEVPFVPRRTASDTSTQAEGPSVSQLATPSAPSPTSWPSTPRACLLSRS